MTISGLRGMGGIGKTALALVLADGLKDKYRDAQFFVNLRGTDPKPLAAAEAMAHVIHGYHPEWRLPESEAEVRGMYNSVLNGQRALLLMDNAAEAKQVEPLIPPDSCLLLVTSRRRFTLPGLYAKDLDTLPPDDARKLLLRIAARIGDQADAIARLCGHLPLALRLAGSALAVSLDLSPADYVKRLADEQRRLGTLDGLAADGSEGVEASIRLSEALLPDDLRALWHALAVFPTDFYAPAAAAVWEREHEQAQDTLSELVRYSLVEFSDKTGRHHLHDLVRLYTGKRLTEAARTTARRRHAEHYRVVAALADDTYLKGGDSVLRGLAIFDLERSNIEAGFAWAKGNAGTHDTAARLCCAYPYAAAYCLGLRQHARDRLAWLEAALGAARRLKNRRAQGNHLGNLGLAYAALGEPRRAIEYHEQQLTIVRQIGDRHGESAALGNLGVAYRNLGEPRRAIEYYEQQLTIVRQTGDRRGEGAALGNLGLAYADLGELRRAVEHYERVLAIAREMGDLHSQGNSLGNLANVCADLGEPRRAIEYYEQALAAARQIGDRRSEGAVLGNLGLAYANLAEARRAIEYYEQSLAIARETGDRHSEGNALGNLGSAYCALGEPRRAIEYYEQHLAIAREIGDRRGEAITSWNRGGEHAKRGDLAGAVELLQVYVDYAREIGHAEAEKFAAAVDELRARLARQ